ncbi:MAG TPA: DNA-directed RNA polymerase subunit omega [Clostridia bacterium]|nr:MAG: DNA-directed RNA polymerase subunit omega [Firmicutes bacterium ADurb.Bin356]HOF94341.1 DNA-directed RNA polymerase subunit omega [Clostridia bacterium]HOR13235.1 DNA-directed RNA polymerase subunit omega [Clostridia bacterium]
MLNYPGVNELVDKAGTRYMLVMAVARRARQLLNNPDKLGDNNPVTFAVNELHEGKISIEYPDEYKPR